METDLTLKEPAVTGRGDKRGLWGIINKKIFVPPALLLVVAVLFGLLNPESFGKGASEALSFTLKYFGWFYTIGSTFLLGFCLWAGFSKYGDIKLGGPDAEPELSLFNWWAIAICAGIAIGIVFFGVSEPMSHYTTPAPFLGYEPKSLAAGEHAMRYAFFHWTFHTYGIYVSSAICIAFAFYNTRKPFKVSSSLYPLIGDRIKGNWGYFVDGLAIFAIVGGVGTSLGFGTMQIGGGMKFLWGIEPNNIVWLLIIGVLTLCYTISSYTGLQKGIRLLSENNIRLYFLLMAFVLFFGPTIHVLESTVTAVGDYLSNLVPMSFYLDPMGKSGWPGSWSNFYWAWWLAFAPIVGLFLVRLGYGRTIRQFVTVNLIGPAIFGMVWFGIFGSTSIYMEHFKNAGIAKVIAEHGNEVSLFALFQHFPMPSLTMILGMLAVAVSFITLADSMTSTIASMTTKGFGESREDKEPPAVMKIFWGIVMGLFSWVLLISGGASALQTSVIVCGLPILVLQIFMVAGYIRAMGNLKEYDKVNPPIRKSSLYEE
ncbi:BCCT family transporter [Desulfonema ishimotonii]|nr:BCCT family transporter [Desulfonema ishimotonii]